MVISFAVAVWFQFLHAGAGLPPLDASTELVVGVAVTTVGWLLVTFLTPAPDPETLRAFHARIRPIGPGWRAVVGDAPTADGESVGAAALAWFLACLAVYAALFGTGYALYGQWALALGLGVVAVGSGGGVLRLLPRIGLR
jgi:solute:Na+ symporter, SSS family